MDAPPAPSQSQTRFAAFDVVRGMFIALICLAHLIGNLPPAVLALPSMHFVRAAFSGTVGFVTLSGMVVGYRLAMREGRAPHLVSRYRKQALRLIFLAHPIILLATYGWKRASGEPPDLVFRTYFITDTLAIIFLVVVPLVARVSARSRLLLAVVLMVAGRALYVLHPAHGGAGLLLTDILSGVGWDSRHLLYEDYPVLTLSGMFLIGSWMGNHYARAALAGQLRALALTYLRCVPAFLLVSAAMLGEWLLLRRDHQQETLRAFLYPVYDFSTYPIYLASVVALVACLTFRELPRRVESFFATLGRNSLFCFIVQYFLMETVPLLLGWRQHMSRLGIALYLVCGIALLNLTARAYERMLAMARSGEAPPGGQSAQAA